MTFSIVARDPDTGAFGVATATGGPCVGALVPHARNGVGAIATQGDTNPFYGPDGLAMLADGALASEVMEKLTRADPGKERRQLLVIGSAGAPAAFTGAEATPSAGSLCGEHFAVAGNMLANDGVLAAAVAAFAETSGSLVERLLAAMLAGEAAGGDQRGTRSAALLVYANQDYPDADCRVDLSAAPLADLQAVVDAIRSGSYAEFASSRLRRRAAPTPARK
jgi:uncharacterized Ntn-hydrolase superfamily protein